jgi:sterol-4alpha-carboxylate 3-dehydrogenase (decarboxylating)
VNRSLLNFKAWPGFIEVGKNGKSKMQIGDGSNLFDWTYIDNIVHGHVLASDKLQKGSPVVQQVLIKNVR